MKKVIGFLKLSWPFFAWGAWTQAYDIPALTFYMVLALMAAVAMGSCQLCLSRLVEGVERHNKSTEEVLVAADALVTEYKKCDELRVAVALDRHAEVRARLVEKS